MAKADKAKLLEFLASLSEEDRKELEETWREKFGKPLSADVDVLDTLRTLQKEFEEFKKLHGTPPKPPAPGGDPGKKKGLLDRLTELYTG